MGDIVQHLVLFHLIQPMRDEGHLHGGGGADILVDDFFQVCTCIAYPSRNHDEGDDFALESAGSAYPVHCFDKDVDTFIAVFVTAAG